MMHPPRLYQGSPLITVLLILSASGFLCCSSETSSSVSLEKLSSDGQWMEAGSVLVSPPIIGRNGDAIVATIKIQEPGLFSKEKMVIQMNLRRSPRPIPTPRLFLLNGLANGELNGNLFQAQKVASSSVRLELNDEGKLVFGGTFSFGSRRIMIPLIEVEELKSSKDARFKFGNFDGDRVPENFDLEEIVWGAAEPYEGAAIPTHSVQEAKLLTWKVCEDYQQLRAQECILWVHLNNPSQWMVVHVGRKGNFEKGWSGWFRTFISHTQPFWIESYDHPPTNGEIEIFLDTNKWWTEVERLTLVDADVCKNAWEKATGQPPTKAFK